MGILRVDHPDIMEFITCKEDQTRLTNFNISVALTESFMKAVEKEEDYDLINPRTNKTMGKLNAKEVFNKIVEMAWKNGEPGIVFIDRINASNPTPEIGEIESTNPCVTGDTLVFTADGRGSVPIQQLAEEGKDVPVFTESDKGKITIRYMRNPRKTGKKVGIYRILLDSGDEIKATANHKFYLRDGTLKRTDQLRKNDSLHIVTKILSPQKGKFSVSEFNKYWRIYNRGRHEKNEHTHIASFYHNDSRPIPTDNVVHHIDFNSMNNMPENLAIMTLKKHTHLHREKMKGKNDPIYKIKKNKRKWNDYKRSNPFYSTEGENNPRYGVTLTDEIKQKISSSVREYHENNPDLKEKLSQISLEFWQDEEYKKNAAKGLKQRAQKKLEECQTQTTFECFLKDNCVKVLKVCEFCGNEFSVSFSERETSYCSRKCSIEILNSNLMIQKNRTLGINKKYEAKAQQNKESQIKVFKDLQSEMGRDPLKEEWENRCKDEEIPFRLGTKYSFTSYTQLKEEAIIYNHRVVNVEYIGTSDVFNGTVDDFHNYFIGGFKSESEKSTKIHYIKTRNCGEQPLLPFESCVSAGTRISTINGFERIEDLLVQQKAGKKILIATQSISSIDFKDSIINYYPATVIHSGKKQIFELLLTNNQCLKATGDHKILTSQGYKELLEINPDDEIIVQHSKGGSFVFDTDIEKVNLYQMFGWFTGDGWLTEKKTFGLTFGPQDNFAFEKLVPVWRNFTETKNKTQVQENLVRCVTTQKNEAKQKFFSYGYKEARAPEKKVPSAIFTIKKELQIAYLQGLFCADGTVHHRKSLVALSSASLELLRDVQLLLINLGIQTDIKYYPVKQRGRSQGNLKISGENFIRFMEIVGFPLTSYKQEKGMLRLSEMKRIYRKTNTIKVKSIKPLGIDDVYDISEPHTQSFIAEGIVVHNCNLGSLNLSHHVANGQLDWALLEQSIRLGVRFLDNVIDKNQYILPEIEHMTKANRKIGLGIMGFADLLVQLGLRYDSEEALSLAEEVMTFIQTTARDESVKLGRERGNFPNFEKSIFKEKYDFMRNATVTTVAPTGTISLIAGCSSGIEPYYAIAFTRNVLGGKKLFDVNPLFEQELKKKKLYSEELIETVSATNTIQAIEEIPEEMKKVFVTSHDISPEWHIKMQAAFQKHIDNATSKTINFPNTAAKEEIANAYMLAYKEGCKGITVYRDGSRKYQVLSTKKTEKTTEPHVQEVVREKVEPRARPEVTEGKTHKIRSGCGNLYVTINRDEKGVCEVFVQVGKSGGCITSQSEAVGRLISLALRSGVRLESVVDHLAGIRCPSPNFYQGKTVLSCADGIAHVLENYTNGDQVMRANGSIACPECGGMLEFSEGCFTCRICGYSKCD